MIEKENWFDEAGHVLGLCFFHCTKVWTTGVQQSPQHWQSARCMLRSHILSFNPPSQLSQLTDGESEIQTDLRTQQRLAKLKGRGLHLLRLVAEPACFPPRYKEARVEWKRECVPGGTKSTVNSSEAGPVGLGFPEEPGIPGPVLSQSLWTASCQNLLGSVTCWWI